MNTYTCWQETHNIFTQMQYCKYGDLLSYLQSLQDTKFVFSNEFFWDIIFEMTCVYNHIALNFIFYITHKLLKFSIHFNHLYLTHSFNTFIHPFKPLL